MAFFLLSTCAPTVQESCLDCCFSGVQWVCQFWPHGLGVARRCSCTPKAIIYTRIRFPEDWESASCFVGKRGGERLGGSRVRTAVCAAHVKSRWSVRWAFILHGVVLYATAFCGNGLAGIVLKGCRRHLDRYVSNGVSSVSNKEFTGEFATAT